MLRKKNYQSIMNRFYGFRYVWSGYCLMLIMLLFQGCSSNLDQDSAFKVKVESINAPKLVLENSSYDFGALKPNSTNKAIFHFANAGDKPLIIKEVKKCCGAVIDLDKEQLAPGENGVLTVEYRAGTGKGSLRRKIGLVTNEPDNPETTLIITGEMNETLQWEPTKFEIASFGKDLKCPEIKIKSLDNTPFSVKNISSSRSCILADFDPNYSATEIVLKPEVSVERINGLTSNNGVIAIKLDHPDYPTVSLSFEIISSLISLPSQLLVFNFKENEPIHKTIEIQDNQAISNRSVPSKIDSIISENGAKVEILKSTNHDDGYELDLEIIPAANKGSESILKDQLVIKMKDGRTLNVPVRIFYASQTLTSKAN